jgi:bifunctional DNase/RNase
VVGDLGTGLSQGSRPQVPNLFLAFTVSGAGFGGRYLDFTLFAGTSCIGPAVAPTTFFDVPGHHFPITLKKIQLEILGLSSSQSQSGSFALILGEKGGNRRLPIIIGMFEAQSIAIQIEKISPNRPLTHDLFKSFAEHVHVVILEVVISDLKEGVFYSRIVCSDGATTFDIDARPSDAIAIGLRFGVPIYTVESVLSEAGIILSDLDENETDPEEDDDEDDSDDADTDSPRATRAQPEPREPNGQVSLDELTKMLAQALEKEDYEKAAKIRDELNKRNG